MEELILIGAGGHAKAILEILKTVDTYKIVGLIDKENERIGGRILGVPIIGSDECLCDFYNKGIKHALIAVGSTGDNKIRKNLYNAAKSIGFNMVNVFHPKAVISQYSKFGEGNVVMAESVIGPDAEVGNNVIINTAAVVEHDCRIGDHVHIAPGSKIAGGVEIGDESFVGIGAVIIQGIKIGKNALIGAGTVIINDVLDNAVVTGVPGKIIGYR
ncbi:acetyltransferase [Calorimonas adulescens]|uniref:Acetyltransferase n=1 Tax=Calorimonas adulescens TaxID=2606906 RepID=A0A5D8QCQ0_9THEO|nr:acetyltransferase [Calorimonas adulescens]TZE82177.1 acetyltransferase [Calorimonas adulescens]